MQIQLNDQYSPSEIDETRDEILKLRYNLNKIEELYHNLYSTFDDQQTHVEKIETSRLEKDNLDFHRLLQLRRRKDKHRYFITIFSFTIACFFLLLIVINVIKTFGFKRITKSNNDR